MSTKRLTITIEYTDSDPDEGRIIKEELEWVMEGIEIGQKYGYNEYPNPVDGTPEIVTQYKIEEV